MTTVVLSSQDLVESLETGVVKEPADVIADRAGPKKAEVKPEKADKPAGRAEDPEDENGLTEEQRNSYTESMKKSIGRKHRQLRDAEEYAADQRDGRRAAEERVGTLQRELDGLKKAAEPKAEPATRPKREAFESQEAYEDAVVDFRVKEQLATEKKAEASRVTQEAERQLNEAAGARVDAARKAVPDWEETLEGAKQVVPIHIQDFMRRDEKFAELGYHFAKNPKELERIAEMPAKSFADVMRVGIELEKISARLKPFVQGSGASSSPETKESKSNGHAGGNAGQPSQETESVRGHADPSTETESAASAGPSKPRESAPVIRPLSAGSTSQVEKNPSQRSTREEIAAWQKQNRAHLTLRKRH
jgi:hypothetical protein